MPEGGSLESNQPAAMLDPTRWIVWGSLLGGNLRDALRWAADHTGLPVVIVAAAALVASLRIFKQGLRFAVEVAVAAAVLFGATKLGLLRW